MSVVLGLILVSLALGIVGLGAFLWTLRHSQYEDLKGAAQRVLFDENDRPIPPKPREPSRKSRQRRDGAS
jgi:cbb3-type cytochrome oxidase maturation protein